MKTNYKFYVARSLVDGRPLFVIDGTDPMLSEGLLSSCIGFDTEDEAFEYLLEGNEDNG